MFPGNVQNGAFKKVKSERLPSLASSTPALRRSRVRDGVKVASFAGAITYSKPCLFKPGVLEGTDGVCDKCVRHQACSAFLRGDRADMCPDHRVSACTSDKRLSGSFGSWLWELPQKQFILRHIAWVPLCPWKYPPVIWIFDIVLFEITLHLHVYYISNVNNVTSWPRNAFCHLLKGVKDNRWHHFLQESESKTLCNESSAILNWWHHLENIFCSSDSETVPQNRLSCGCSCEQEVAVSHEPFHPKNSQFSWFPSFKSESLSVTNVFGPWSSWQELRGTQNQSCLWCYKTVT